MRHPHLPRVVGNFKNMFQTPSFKRKDVGFTLAEVLMVLGIIALLAGLILIGTKGIREKARITKILNFSAQIHHALGAEAVGIWDFDDETFNDKSGNGNNGSCQGNSCPAFVRDTPSQTGYGLNFDGQNDYVSVVNNSSLDFDDKITISLWVKFNSLSGGQTFVHGRTGGAWTTSYWFGKKEDGKIRFNLQTPPPEEALEAPVSLSTNVWYHLVATYNGSNAKIYLDGQEIKSQPRTGNIEKCTEDCGLRIGKTGGTDYPLYGIIDDLRIYKEGLSSSQIKKLYVEGLKKHLTMNNE